VVVTGELVDLSAGSSVEVLATAFDQFAEVPDGLLFLLVIGYE